MRKNIRYLFLAFLGFIQFIKAQKIDHDLISVHKALEAVFIDGKAEESFWGTSLFRPLDQNWIGEDFSSEDFNGRYKLAWKSDAIYLLVEITDDVYYDQYSDPYTLWWDDDCVEIFVDPDNSGGEHQYNNNAFAYHVSLSGDVIDFANDKKPRNYKEHVQSAYTQKGNVTLWELKVKLYSDVFIDGTSQLPNTLQKNDKIGFALAYCDNDGSKERENFIGNVFVPGEDKDKGWIDANIFSTLLLEN